MQNVLWNKSQNSYTLNFKTCKNFEKFISRWTNQTETKKDWKSWYFYIVSIFKQKNWEEKIWKTKFNVTKEFKKEQLL